MVGGWSAVGKLGEFAPHPCLIAKPRAPTFYRLAKEGFNYALLLLRKPAEKTLARHLHQP